MKKIIGAIVLAAIVTLPVITWAASKKPAAAAVAAEHFNGTFIHSDQQSKKFPTRFYIFSGDSFSCTEGKSSSNGKFSVTGDTIEFVYSDGKINIAKFLQTSNTITLTFSKSEPETYVRATSERLAAIEEVKAEFARKFIAVSEKKMT